MKYTMWTFMYACVPGRTLKSSDGAKRAFSEKTSQLPAHVWTVAPTFRVPGCCCAVAVLLLLAFCSSSLRLPTRFAVRSWFHSIAMKAANLPFTFKLNLQVQNARWSIKRALLVRLITACFFWTPFDKHVWINTVFWTGPHGNASTLTSTSRPISYFKEICFFTFGSRQHATVNATRADTRGTLTRHNPHRVTDRSTYPRRYRYVCIHIWPITWWRIYPREADNEQLEWRRKPTTCVYFFWRRA